MSVVVIGMNLGFVIVKTKKMTTLRRSRVSRYVGGVCGGIAKWTDTSPLAWRIAFILVPSSSIVYLALWMLLKKY
jgi:phage shock protein PspC (stress-responsive transcriptional regulator)|tara:strand:- start:46 stop:270 length:225 start_codon:yes stop_codon:yes gene_type:complete